MPFDKGGSAIGQRYAGGRSFRARVSWLLRDVGRGDDSESALDFGTKCGDVGGENRFLRINDDLCGNSTSAQSALQGCVLMPNYVTHAALDAVAIDGAAEDTSDGDADLHVASPFAQDKEKDHARGKLLASGLIDMLKVSVLEQPRGLGKSIPLLRRRRHASADTGSRWPESGAGLLSGCCHADDSGDEDVNGGEQR